MYFISILDPWTEYKIWVKAFTLHNTGEPSDPVVVRTSAHGPGPPFIHNLSCIEPGTSLSVTWKPPDRIYGGISYYYLYYRSEDDPAFTQILVNKTTELYVSFI